MFKDLHFHAIKVTILSLTAYNFCYECATDLISFPVDHKYEIRHEYDKRIENRPIITAVVP